jgi:hypothetical protein
MSKIMIFQTHGLKQAAMILAGEGFGDMDEARRLHARAWKRAGMLSFAGDLFC